MSRCSGVYVAISNGGKMLWGDKMTQDGQKGRVVAFKEEKRVKVHLPENTKERESRCNYCDNIKIFVINLDLDMDCYEYCNEIAIFPTPCVIINIS